jgi:uncharacterized protein
MQSRIMTVGLYLAILPLQVHADSVSKHAKVKEIFRLSKMQDRMEQTREVALAEARSFADAQLAAYALPQAQAQETADYYQKVHTLIAERYDWEKMEPQYEQVYVDLFTEKELGDILQFYRSPAGQAFLSKAPELTKQLLDINEKLQEFIKPQIIRLTKEHIARLRAMQKH